MPYGTERVISDNLDNTYKFTGHERDSESGLDHTLYRKYASNLARWHSPDPVTGKPGNPQSWNRYVYAANNPCNAVDPEGASEHRWSWRPSWEECLPGALNCSPRTGNSFFGPNPAPILRPVDEDTNEFAREGLKKRLEKKEVKKSNCHKVFSQKIEGYDYNDLWNTGMTTNFFNARAEPYASMTQDEVVGNGDQTTLSNSIAEGAFGRVIEGPAGKAVLLGPNTLSAPSAAQQNILLHETLHVYFGNDELMFNTFADKGLDGSDYRQYGNTHEITDWLARDCQPK